jgi:predicted DNA-binding transcriptional regulator YafY
VITRPDARRAAGRPALPRPAEPPAVGEAQLAELVRAVRAGDRAVQSAQRSAAQAVSAAVDVPGVTTATTLGLLRDAAAANQAVLLGYVNAQGAASQRIVEPASVNGGYLHGYDHQRDEMRTFALHRITSVSVLADDALPED